METPAFFALSCLLALPSLAQAQTLSPAQQILRACANTYKSLHEFKGGASVISLTSLQIGKAAPGTHLRNADAHFDFVRGQHFNITGHDTERDSFDITSTPQKTTQKWQPQGKERIEKADDIEMAVASFTGVAAGAPTTVPALLLGSYWGFPFITKDAATLKGSEVFGGHPCYVVVQQLKAVPQTVTLWIDTKTFLLRGMREEQSESTFPIGNAASKVMPTQQAKVLFGNDMHIFSIEKTVPGEAELELAAKKTLNLSPYNPARKAN